MRRFGVILGLILAASLLGAPAALAQAPSFTLVGVAQGTTSSRVQGLSADGSIAAGWSGTAGAQPGFTWTGAGGRHDFGLDAGLPMATHSAAISGDGSAVVGASWTGDPFTSRAFRYRGPGQFETLGVFGGYTRSYALGASGDGGVVVGYDEATQNQHQVGQAFRWTPAGGMQGLGFAEAGHTYSEATGISRDGGTIVGNSLTPTSGFQDAFVWTSSGGMQILPQLPGTPFPNSAAFGVNFDGSIIVGESAQVSRAVVWQNGNILGLGQIAGYALSAALAVNDDGSVIVGRQTNVNNVACIWTTSRGPELLVDYLAANGVAVPAGWTLFNAYAVSGDGLTIAGLAISGAQGQGFVARVPAPGMLTMNLGVLAMAAGRRKRRWDSATASHWHCPVR